MRRLADPAFFRFHGLAAASGFPESFAGAYIIWRTYHVTNCSPQQGSGANSRIVRVTQTT